MTSILTLEGKNLLRTIRNKNKQHQRLLLYDRSQYVLREFLLSTEATTQFQLVLIEMRLHDVRNSNCMQRHLLSEMFASSQHNLALPETQNIQTLLTLIDYVDWPSTKCSHISVVPSAGTRGT